VFRHPAKQQDIHPSSALLVGAVVVVVRFAMVKSFAEIE
jgi:hypothetical protein